MALPLAAAVAACGRANGEDRADTTRAVMTVGRENVTIVQAGEIVTGPTISGSLTPQLEATVRAEVPGAVVQTYVEKGQAVPRGALLVRIDETVLRDAFLSARSAVHTAEQAAVVARRNAERAERLSEAGAIADRDLEQARWNATSAESQLADARARFGSAQQQLAKASVRAPFAGIVSDRPVSAGDVVSPGTALVSIVEPGTMRLEGSVPAEQLAAVRVGAPVEFRVNGYPGRTFTGRVDRVNPVADPTTRQVRVYVSLPNDERRLVSGLFAEGRINSERKQGLVAPETAIDVRGLRPLATRIKDGKVETVEVQLGMRDPQTETYEVIAGLQAGDTLLLGAARGITPGSPVRVGDVLDQPRAQR
jgi:RND family efflux transporter MFP subunit